MKIPLSEVPKRLNDFEGILNKFFRKDIVNDYKVRQDEFDLWQKTTKNELDPIKEALDTLFAECETLRRQVFEMQERLPKSPPRNNAQELESYNRAIMETNRMAANQRQRSDEYIRAQEDYNARIKGWNREQHDRLESLERMRTDELERYIYWRQEQGPENFFRQVNSLYASLLETTKTEAHRAGEVNAYLSQVKKLRAELANDARTEQSKRQHGVLIAPAILAGQRQLECHLIVDPAATSVTITAEIVRILGLADKLGSEVEVLLPGGKRAYGREITLPSVTVQGKTASDVKAIQLEESHCGVDGLLGLTFLDNFNYSIHREKPQRLQLRLKSEIYDVFISYNTRDEWFARIVHDALVVMDYTVYLSKVTQLKQRETNYMQTIQNAIQGSRHLIVVTSSFRNLEDSFWVNEEVNLFVQKMVEGESGHSMGSVLCGNATAAELIPFLRSRQAIKITDENFREQLRMFFPLDSAAAAAE